MIGMNFKLNNLSFIVLFLLKLVLKKNSKMVEVIGSTKAYIIDFGLLNPHFFIRKLIKNCQVIYYK